MNRAHKTLLSAAFICSVFCIPTYSSEDMTRILIAAGTMDIFEAAKSYSLKSVQRLIATDASVVNQQNEKGQTPLHVVCLSEVAQALIDGGADVNKADKDGNTPLHCAAEDGKEEIARALIRADADVNRPNNGDNTPLHMAAIYARPVIVKELIAAGARLDQENGERRTPEQAVLDTVERARAFDEEDIMERYEISDYRYNCGNWSTIIDLLRGHAQRIQQAHKRAQQLAHAVAP